MRIAVIGHHNTAVCAAVEIAKKYNHDIIEFSQAEKQRGITITIPEPMILKQYDIGGFKEYTAPLTRAERRKYNRKK